MSYPAQEGRNPLATAHTTPPESTQFASSASIHPAASTIPEPTPAEYDRLKKDISEHGVRIAVVMTDDGRILDGRSRVKACTELGIKYPTRPATPDEMLDPAAASRSLNVHRRHLSTDQIDQILATYITDNAPKIEADRQAAKAAQRAGLKQGTARGVEGHLTGKTSAKIAKDTGMPEDAVKRVLKVQKDAPERLRDLAAGKVSAGEVLKGAQSGKKKTAKGKASAAKAGKQVTGQGYQGYDMKYGVGRRSIESLMVRAQPARYAVELWLQRLADAKRMGHAKFDEWLEPAVQWYSKVGIVLDMLQKRPAPTGEEIEAILNPDQQQDEAAEAPDSVAQP
jgi:hypothetical protein